MIPIKFENNDVTGYQRWNYKWWYALAEFVDNSTHNYYANQEQLDSVYSENSEKLNVRITVDRDGDEEVIQIFDNAMGMSPEDLADAFDFGRRKKNPGRSAYGLGMKTAAIWMGDKFEIETSKLGNGKKYIVVFDVQKVAREGMRSLELTESDCDENLHFTKITVSKLTKRLRGSTVRKVKDHLASIYRVDLRTNLLNLEYNGVSLEWTLYDDDSFMEARDGTKYKQNYEYETSTNKKVTGWFGLFAPGKGGRVKAGFSTIQNDRVIAGYPKAWRPEAVFGAEEAGTLLQQRMFGEFYFEGFPLSQTKDEILFTDTEYDEIQNDLEEKTRNYRGIASQTYASLGLTGSGPSDHAVQDALDTIGQEIQSQEATAKLSIVPSLPPEVLEAQNQEVISRAQEAEQPRTVYRVGDTEVKLYFDDVSAAEPYYVNQSPNSEELIVVVNRAHPAWCMLTNQEAAPYLRHCIIDGVAEHRANQLRGTIEVNEQTVKKQKDDLLRLRFEILPD